LSRLLCPGLNIRVYTVLSTATVNEITGLHGAGPLGAVILGRALTATALLAATLKPDSAQSIRFQVRGDGPAGHIHVQGDARGNLRGYMGNPRVGIGPAEGKIDMDAIIGRGNLSVSRDLGMKEPYTGVLPLRSGDIAMETARYLTVSEQVPSALILGMDFSDDGRLAASGGILIQSFPDTPVEALAIVEHHIAVAERRLGEALKAGEDVVDYAAELAGNHPLTPLSSAPLRAACRCSRDMIGEILSGIDERELEMMIEEDGGIEIACAFCEKKYYFNGEQARMLTRRH